MKLSSKALLALAISTITATAYAETQSQDFVPTTLAGTSASAQRSQQARVWGCCPLSWCASF